MSADFSVDDIRPDDLAEAQRAAYGNDIKRLLERRGEFVEVACPACGSPFHASAFDKYDCHFVRCTDCETLYMSPRPSPAVLDAYYSDSENYRLWRTHIFPRSEPARREGICAPNLEYTLDRCHEAGFDSPHLLEIGPGFGTFSELARASGRFASVVVVERNPDLAAECRKRGLDVVENSLEELPAQQRPKADCCVCFEVIEHTFDPLLFLEHIRGFVRLGGLLIMTCPNGLGFDTRCLGAASPAVDTEHLNLFNPQSIGRLLNRAGFRLIRWDTPGRLDADIVRRAVLAGELSLPPDDLLQDVLIDQFPSLGPKFQSFLRAQGLSGNLRFTARLEGTGPG